jgi:hypothetical protein
VGTLVMRSMVEGDAEATRLQELAAEALCPEPGLLLVSVTSTKDRLYLEMTDGVEHGWHVSLPFRRGTDKDEVRQRVRNAAQLRHWETAPPAVETLALPRAPA